MIRPPSYWHRLGDALSQLANVAIWNGNANESISGRSHRAAADSQEVIDLLLGPGHCRGAYIADIARAIHLTETVPAADLAEARAKLRAQR